MTILGHDRAIAAFFEAMHGARPPHAWLFCGREGLGKATLAKLAARRLLAEAVDQNLSASPLALPDDHPTAAMFAAWSHPDYILVDRLPSDPKVLETPRNDWLDTPVLRRSIRAVQVRDLNHRFATFPTYSSTRVVVIDEAETCEIEASNALLKNLEEPPKGTIFILTSQNPGRLLPTIRSRCRLLRFEPLDEDTMRVALRRHLPEASEAELSALIASGVGAPGRALAYAGLDLSGLDASLQAIAETGDATNKLRADLAGALSAKAAQKRYEAFLARVPAFIAGQARTKSGQALAAALDAWDGARKLAESAVRQSLDPQMTVFALGGHVASLADTGNNAKA